MYQGPAKGRCAHAQSVCPFYAVSRYVLYHRLAPLWLAIRVARPVFPLSLCLLTPLENYVHSWSYPYISVDIYAIYQDNYCWQYITQASWKRKMEGTHECPPFFASNLLVAIKAFQWGRVPGCPTLSRSHHSCAHWDSQAVASA